MRVKIEIILLDFGRRCRIERLSIKWAELKHPQKVVVSVDNSHFFVVENCNTAVTLLDEIDCEGQVVTLRLENRTHQPVGINDCEIYGKEATQATKDWKGMQLLRRALFQLTTTDRISADVQHYRHYLCSNYIIQNYK